MCGCDYRIELFNIFELVLNNAIFSILSDGYPNQIKISKNQYKQLESLFKKMDHSQISSIILGAVDRLQHHFSLKDPQMIDYLKQSGVNLIKRVQSVVRYNRLQTMVIVEKELNSKPIITTFKASARMSDNRFRLFVEKIMNCERTAEKVDMIRDNFHSLHDYIDILNTDCLLNDEYQEIFKTFGDVELAILTKIVFYEELRNDPIDFSFSNVIKTETESEWQIQFIKFINKMYSSRKLEIQQIVYEVDYEEISFY